jgi:hypothetical protein
MSDRKQQMNLSQLKMWKRKQLTKEKQKKKEELLQCQRKMAAKKSSEYTVFAPNASSPPHKCFWKVPNCYNNCGDCLQQQKNSDPQNQRTEK